MPRGRAAARGGGFGGEAAPVVSRVGTRSSTGTSTRTVAGLRANAAAQRLDRPPAAGEEHGEPVRVELSSSSIVVRRWYGVVIDDRVEPPNAVRELVADAAAIHPWRKKL